MGLIPASISTLALAVFGPTLSAILQALAMALVMVLRWPLLRARVCENSSPYRMAGREVHFMILISRAPSGRAFYLAESTTFQYFA